MKISRNEINANNVFWEHFDQKSIFLLTMKNERFSELLNPNFIFVNGMVILGNEEENEEYYQKNYELMIKNLKSKTEIEIASNEFLINYFFEDHLSFSDYLGLGIELLSYWKQLIKMRLPDQKICYILSGDMDSGNVIVKLHVMREGEAPWLDFNLNNYLEPVAYVID